MASQLSPQGALYSLTIIALSTMFGTPSRVCGYPKEEFFYLKSSPWVCAVDVLSAVNDTLTSAEIYSFRGLSNALHEVARAKFDGGNEPIHKVQTTIRFALFTFGALPQAINLFACHGRGAFRTQLRAACYLTSFVFDGGMFYLARRLNNKKPTSREEFISETSAKTEDDPWLQWLRALENNTYRVITYCLADILIANLFTLDVLYMQIVNANSLMYSVRRTTDSVFFTTLSVIAGSAMPYLVTGIVMPRFVDHPLVTRIMEFRSNSPYFFYCFILTCVNFVSSWIKIYLTSSFTKRGGSIVREENFAVAVNGMIAYMWISLCQRHDWKRRWANVAFLALNTVVMLQYYGIEFNAAMTYKPDWTEWLGSPERTLSYLQYLLKGGEYAISRIRAQF